MSYKFSRRFPYVKKGYSSAAQRVIIPQGLISPHKTTIIEIPENLQNTPTVIATSKNESFYNEFRPIQTSSMRDSYIYPKDPNASASLGASQYTNSFSSAEPPPRSRNVIEEENYADVPDERPADAVHINRAKGESFPRTRLVNNRYLYDDGVTYGGMGYDFSPNQLRSFYQSVPAGCGYESEESGGCVQQCSTYESAESEMEPPSVGVQRSAYENFEPAVFSTPQGYVQSAESYLNAFDYSIDQPHPGAYLAQAASLCSQHSYDADNTPAGLKRILDELDQKELHEMQQNLKNVQSARRKLIYDASNIKH